MAKKTTFLTDGIRSVRSSGDRASHGTKTIQPSMIKAKQTVEYMVKLQCEQAGIMEGSMDSMIHELYNNGWISKSTAEHYLQIYDIGTKAAKNGDNGATMQTRPTTCCPRRVYSFADNGKAPAEDARPVAVPSSPETAAPVPGSRKRHAAG